MNEDSIRTLTNEKKNNSIYYSQIHCKEMIKEVFQDEGNTRRKLGDISRKEEEWK